VNAGPFRRRLTESALRIPPSSTSLTDTTRPGLRAKPLLPGLVGELQEVENEEELRGLREDGQAESNPFAEFLAEDAA
jgi:hypothetical protein